MMDYKKLKEAHELLMKLSHQEPGLLSLNTRFIVDCFGDVTCTYSIFDGGLITGTYSDLDEIITTLNAAIKPQPKFKVGDEIYFYVDYEQAIYSFKIANVLFDENGIHYLDSDDEFCVQEHRAYPTHEGLIDAQLEYWKDMREIWAGCDKDASIAFKCVPHVLDGFTYVNKKMATKLPERPRTPHELKCKKCGVFLTDKEEISALRNISTESLSNEDKAILKDTEYEEAKQDENCYCGQIGALGYKIKNCGYCGADSDTDCAHESDGMVYCSYPPQNKCKKCGEFYQ